MSSSTGTLPLEPSEAKPHTTANSRTFTLGFLYYHPGDRQSRPADLGRQVAYIAAALPGRGLQIRAHGDRRVVLHDGRNGQTSPWGVGVHDMR